MSTHLINLPSQQNEPPLPSVCRIKRDVLGSIRADIEYRHAWNLESVYTGICFQIRALREQRGWSQGKLGKQVGMAQERISILEDPNAETKPTLNTLLRIADGYDVGLEVRFVPYSTVLHHSTKTNLADLEVQSFENELPDIERQLEAEELREKRAKDRSLLAAPAAIRTINEQHTDIYPEGGSNVVIVSGHPAVSNTVTTIPA